MGGWGCKVTSVIGQTVGKSKRLQKQLGRDDKLRVIGRRQDQAKAKSADCIHPDQQELFTAKLSVLSSKDLTGQDQGR